MGSPQGERKLRKEDMANKVKTMRLNGSTDYAKVAERLKQFREDNPKAKTESIYEYDVDQSLVFTVYVWKDKTDYIDVLKEVKDAKVALGSADANGSAKGVVGQKQKDFEKLETIALGRALAMLGYLSSGEIASSEEMEAFNAYRDAKIEGAAQELAKCKTIDELKAAFMSLGSMMADKRIVEAKDKRKAELTNENPAS